MKRLILLALSLCLLLSGCQSISVLPEGGEEAVRLPEPGGDDPLPVTEDSVAVYECTARLYYPTLDQRDLAAVIRTLNVAQDAAPHELVLDLLLTQTPTGLSPAAPEGTTLLSVCLAGGIATVDLSLSKPADEQSIFLTQAAIASTLTSLDGIEAVNLLLDGKKPALRTLSTGLNRQSSQVLSAQWSQLLADEELFSTASITRDAAVYYADSEGLYLTPQIVEISLTSDTMLQELLSAMLPAPEISGLRAVLPSESLLTEPPRLLTTANGERVARLSFDANLMAAMQSCGLPAWQLYGALTLTLTDFVPTLDGVCVYVGEGQLLKTTRGEQEISFPGGIMHREDFLPFIGESMTIYLTDAEGRLRAANRLRPAAQQPVSARMLVQALLDGPCRWEDSLCCVTPDGLRGDDLLGVAIRDGVAILNFSAGFYERCQSLTTAQERNLAYALVNTLTNLPMVQSVYFQREGLPVEYLANDIYLRTPLIRNPGLIEGERIAP